VLAGCPSEELNTAIAEIPDVTDIGSVAEVEPGNSGVARRIRSPTKQHAAFEQAAAHPRLLDLVEQLIGPDILFPYSKLHLKAPQVGSVVDRHQDFAYYPHTNTDLVTALIHLDDTTIENSCLQAIPGSHRRGPADHYVDGTSAAR
jgi:phytanoyl-CoA hydroxylase